MKYLLSIFLALTLPLAAQDRSFGWKSNPRHSLRLNQIVKDPAYKAVPVPDAASVKGWMPKIRDQKDIGSCTAFAGIGAHESAYKRAHGQWLTMSPLDLYQQSLDHDGNWGEDAGSYNSTALWVLAKKGVSTERLWPYDPRKLAVRPPARAVANRPYHVAKVAYDVPNDDGGLAVMRCIALLRRGVIAGGYVYNGIMEPRYDQTTGKTYIPMPSGRVLGGHAIVYVSYDKNLTISGIKGWVEIRNSWSEAWGDKGYGWMPMAYAFNPRQMEDFACIER